MTNPYNPITENEYLGGNSIFLKAISEKYESPLFAGYQQWKVIGRSVKKGEKGYKILIVFKKDDEKKVTNRTVFNYKQTESITTE